MQRLKDKVAIVTGAAGGIGKSVAMLFAQEGAKVVATDMREGGLKEWILTANKSKLNITYVKHNVADEKSWKKVIEKTVDVYGKIDILVNNAGIFPGFDDCVKTSEAEWDKVISVNLKGAFLGCRAAIPHLRLSTGCSIINIASIAGLVGGNGPAYSASKGGLRLLTKDLAVTLAQDGIRVNCICPGAVRTPMTEDLLKLPGMEETTKEMCPQRRIAEPEEIAWGALYLASDESSFVTGIDLTIDGGAVAR